MAQGDKKPVVMESDIGAEGGVPPYLHASQHSASGADPITPDMIGAATFISSFAQLGFTEATATDMIALANAMPDKSIALLQCNTDAAANGLVPGTWGGLLMYRKGVNVMCEFGKIGATLRHFGYVNLNQSSWSGWKQYATTDYAVNKAGDTMTGFLALETSSPRVLLHNNNYERWAQLNLTNNGHLTLFNMDVDPINVGLKNYAAITIRNGDGSAADAFRVISCVEGVSTHNTLLHTGNKPSGSYTGNGDATPRTIKTGGIGNAVAIWSSESNGVILPAGAICTYNNAPISILPAEARYYNGDITLATTHAALNKSGVTYCYYDL